MTTTTQSRRVLTRGELDELSELIAAFGTKSYVEGRRALDSLASQAERDAARKAAYDAHMALLDRLMALTDMRGES